MKSETAHPFRRTAIASIVAIVATTAAWSFPGFAGAQEEFVPGSGRAKATIVRVGPSASQLSLAPSVGVALTDYTNTVGRGEALLVAPQLIFFRQSTSPWPGFAPRTRVGHMRPASMKGPVMKVALHLLAPILPLLLAASGPEIPAAAIRLPSRPLEVQLGAWAAAPTQRVFETREEFENAMREQVWDVIISDYHLPRFSAPEALEIHRWSGVDVPFIVVSGAIGEETGTSIREPAKNGSAVGLAPTGPPLDLLPPALRPFRLTRAQMLTAGVAVVALRSTALQKDQLTGDFAERLRQHPAHDVA